MRARIRAIDTGPARAVAGVRAVLTHADVPGAKLVGPVIPDQPVLAFDEVRHHGEPVALVAADDPATARRAAALVRVDYEPLAPVTDPAAGAVLRTVRVVHGDPEEPAGAVRVRGSYEVGVQDQAFLGPESGLALPDGRGGVELHVATQWLHMDRDQVAAGLGLGPEQVRIVLAGVGGAFGAREDLSVQLHACLLALATGRPVKMSYARDRAALPGGPFGATTGEGVRRRVGYAAGFENVAYSEGFDDFTVARVRLVGDDRAEVHTAAVEVGQGVVGAQEQVAREELGVTHVEVLPADTTVGSAGSASASRLTWMASGAVRAACRRLRERRDAGEKLPLAEEATYRHRPTFPLDPETGQGEVHVAFGFVAHRAVVDVDVELGTARVVELACAQDVGRAMNPLALEVQLEGGSVQGLGLALTEELVIEDGLVQNAGFGDYRIPTIADAPRVPTIVLELGDPDAPYGVKGAGELPAISSTPAVLAALRAATGRPLTRVPVHAEDLLA